MIDAGHVILAVIAVIAGIFALRGNKRARQLSNENSQLKIDKIFEEVKRESLSKSNSERINDLNKRYGPGSGQNH